MTGRASPPHLGHVTRAAWALFYRQTTVEAVAAVAAVEAVAAFRAGAAIRVLGE